MAEKKPEDIVYSSNVIDFVTVAVEFCAYLEKEQQPARRDWVQTMLRLLPLLYVKATLLPQAVVMDDAMPDSFVREEDYARVAAAVASVLREEDTYLDVFVPDMKYSDTPISAFISEDIADIYQDVRNFVSVYQYGLTEQMNDALFVCAENFGAYWGQKLVNVLRPLHALLYSPDEESDAESGLNDDNLWD